jgi:MFS family permease
MEHSTSETQPLLPRPARQNHNSPSQGKRLLKTPRALTLAVFLVLILISFADQLAQYPQTRIFESIICYMYYEQNDKSKIKLGRDTVGPGAIGGVDEAWCKVDAVQNELASLGGYLQMFNSIPNLLLAIPFGWYADRYGRWPLMFINLLQLVLVAGFIQSVAWFWQNFSLRTIWMSAFFSILGGGPPISSALFFVVLSDITPEAARAAVYLRAGAVNISASLFMPPLAAWLMTITPWIPFLGSTCLLVLGTLLWLSIPETLEREHLFRPTVSNHPSPTVSFQATLDPAVTDQSPSAGFVQEVLLSTKETSKFILEDWRVPALIVPFCGHMLIAASGPLLLQYISKRYDLTFSQGTLLITTRNSMNVLLLLVILPYLSTVLVGTFGLNDQRKDLYLARVSQVLVALGWTLLAASPNWPASVISLAIASLGQGSMLMVRSFLASLVSAHHIATVYSIISMWDALGTMVGAPLLAKLYRHGMELGSGWVGLPFYFVGLLSFSFACLLCLIQLRKEEESIGTEENE